MLLLSATRNTNTILLPWPVSTWNQHRIIALPDPMYHMGLPAIDLGIDLQMFLTLPLVSGVVSLPLAFLPGICKDVDVYCALGVGGGLSQHPVGVCWTGSVYGWFQLLSEGGLSIICWLESWMRNMCMSRANASDNVFLGFLTTDCLCVHQIQQTMTNTSSITCSLAL